MEAILDNIVNNIYLYLAVLVFIIVIIILIVTRPKKVKPIDLETIEVEKNEKTDIEKVLESLQENKESRSMTTFEEEQDANAIISYQELVEAVKLKKETGVEFTNNAENKTLIAEDNVETTDKLDDSLVVETVEPKKFKNSEFISPIFGKDSNKNNDEFLKELKDFRNNL